MTVSLGFAVLVFVVYVVAVARVTWLVNHDTILDPLRVWIAHRARDDDASVAERRRWARLQEFLGCVWCVGMWIALATAVLPVLYVGLPWWCFLPVALATSHLVGVSESLSSSEEIEIVEVD